MEPGVLDVHDTAVTAASLTKLRHIDTLHTLTVQEDVDRDKLRAAMGRLEIVHPPAQRG